MSVVDECFAAALSKAGVRKDQLDYIATTGEGDVIPWRTGHFYGMTTHARGALFIDPAHAAPWMSVRCMRAPCALTKTGAYWNIA